MKRGEPSIGSWLSIPSPFSAECMCRLGFDWLVIDMEHNPISIETAALMTSSMFGSSTAPLVRIPWNTGENIKRVLDMGAWGIVVPMVKTREEAERVVREAKYSPEGGRSVGGRRHAMGFSSEPSTYYAQANDEILVVVQIEHIEAIRNLGDILSVPGIDACFIGPNDLMSSMGLRPQMTSEEPTVIEAIERVRTTAKKYGVASGIHVSDAETANARIAEGFQFIAIGSELSFMMNQGQEVLNGLVNNAVHSYERREIRY